MPHPDQRRAELLRRRLTGDDFATIAHELDYPDAAAAAAEFAAALADTDHLAPEVRHQAECHALDELHAATWKKATDGDLAAIETVLRLGERRSRLLGLDAPAQLEAAAPPLDASGVTAAELEELLALTEDPPL
ncbi:hypothetical protein [Streptomyces ipomoeae]|uniref:hypothetical protein n=1 Tax=Streptomyces ipomoeae TaxID=103232 RepID=UPI0011472F79|nr:hypothetical protein [Streptomyces ipomoeae]TQE33043.1 hypothetical protein Sipo7851_21305 [Streptomyces ipomoeae]